MARALVMIVWLLWSAACTPAYLKGTTSTTLGAVRLAERVQVVPPPRWTLARSTSFIWLENGQPPRAELSLAALAGFQRVYPDVIPGPLSAETRPQPADAGLLTLELFWPPGNAAARPGGFRLWPLDFEPLARVLPDRPVSLVVPLTLRDAGGRVIYSGQFELDASWLQRPEQLAARVSAGFQQLAAQMAPNP